MITPTSVFKLVLLLASIVLAGISNAQECTCPCLPTTKALADQQCSLPSNDCCTVIRQGPDSICCHADEDILGGSNPSVRLETKVNPDNQLEPTEKARRVKFCSRYYSCIRCNTRSRFYCVRACIYCYI
eukprot:GO255711.1.p1 GENE.GO255711.1~~GO255711.1.p1  ORF type:complete len:129 (+),score=0.09 GO255711.1:57-443(+)